jgi:MFS family permease
MAALIVCLISYISSRPITGTDPLTDWRLLAGFIGLLIAFIVRERTFRNPFIPLSVFGVRPFPNVIAVSTVRMFAIAAVGLLVPLYLTDLRGLSASLIGILVTIQAVMFLLPMRFGGWLADRRDSRWPVMIGLSLQAAGVLFIVLLSPEAPLVWFVFGLILNGLGSGLSLAALHRAALSRIPKDRTGVVAGLYSSFRFGGQMIGSALAGVLLQLGITGGFRLPFAYNLVFGFVAAICFAAAVFGWGLKR